MCNCAHFRPQEFCEFHACRPLNHSVAVVAKDETEAGEVAEAAEHSKNLNAI